MDWKINVNEYVFWTTNFILFFLLHLKKCEQSKDSLMKSLKCMNREYKKIKNKKVKFEFASVIWSQFTQI